MEENAKKRERSLLAEYGRLQLERESIGLRFDNVNAKMKQIRVAIANPEIKVEDEGSDTEKPE